MFISIIVLRVVLYAFEVWYDSYDSYRSCCSISLGPRPSIYGIVTFSIKFLAS